jgi:antirestriction protein
VGPVNGSTKLQWIDAAQPPDAIHEEIAAMLAESPEPDAEEWAIHDYEGFGNFKLSEHETVEDVARFAQLIEQHGEMFTEVLGHFGTLSELDTAETAMTEHYQGAYDDLADWAYQFAMDTVGEQALGPYGNYIDWERVGDDAQLAGDVFTVEHDGRVHVFGNH